VRELVTKRTFCDWLWSSLWENSWRNVLSATDCGALCERASDETYFLWLTVGLFVTELVTKLLSVTACGALCERTRDETYFLWLTVELFVRELVTKRTFYDWLWSSLWETLWRNVLSAIFRIKTWRLGRLNLKKLRQCQNQSVRMWRRLCPPHIARWFPLLRNIIPACGTQTVSLAC
jgi:hypothetical protein